MTEEVNSAADRLHVLEHKFASTCHGIQQVVLQYTKYCGFFRYDYCPKMRINLPNWGDMCFVDIY